MARKATTKRKTKKIAVAHVVNAPEMERQLLGCCLHLLERHHEKVVEVLRPIPAEAFSVDGAAEFAVAMLAECDDQASPSVGGVFLRARSAIEAEGVEWFGCHTKVEIDRAAIDTSIVGASDGGLMDWMLRAANDVVKANAQRVKLLEADEVYRQCGLPTPAVLMQPGKKSPATPNGSTDRSAIVVNQMRMDETVDAAVSVLAKDYFVSGGALAVIDPGGAGTTSAADLMICHVSKERLMLHLAKNIRCQEYREDADGNVKQVDVAVPPWLAQIVHGMQRWPGVPPLSGIARGPFLRPDGTIGGTTKGHDAATGLWVETDGEWPGIVMEPTQADAEAARDTLMDLLREFRFADADVAKAVWLSALLTIIGRPAFLGPAPVFCIDAPTPGSGKGLLSRLISLVATGREPSMSGMPAKNNEMEKVLTSFHAARAQLAIFDNVTTPVGGAALDRQATATEWSDRLLGGNRIGEWTNHLTLLVNGNNLTIASDMARRVLHMRLSPEVERPEELTFERGDLAGYVMQNRRKLVAAALTILRRQVVAGDDGARPAPMASFEGWSGLVQRAVVGCGLPDPLASREAVRGKDAGTAARREFLEALAAWDSRFENSARWLWEELHGKSAAGNFLAMDDAAERLRTASDELVGMVAVKGETPPQTLSKVFGSMDGRLFGALRLTRGGGRTKTGACWKLDGAQPDGVADDLDDSPMARRAGF
jgi:hypothetical protein